MEDAARARTTFNKHKLNDKYNIRLFLMIEKSVTEEP